jgi:branched-subunit amino acid transport protein
VARAVSEVWLTIVVVGTATLAMKALPALLLGGRSVPPVVTGIFEALAPALLAALVVTQTFGGDEELVLDPRAAGLGAAAIAVALRSPIVATALVAAVAAAIVRSLT